MGPGRLPYRAARDIELFIAMSASSRPIASCSMMRASALHPQLSVIDGASNGRALYRLTACSNGMPGGCRQRIDAASSW